MEGIEFESAPPSKIVGLYQNLLRRCLEHFFPEAGLDVASDRSLIKFERPSDRENRVLDDPDGIGLDLSWFGARFLLLPGSPTPFRPAERRLVEVIVRVLSQRYQTLFDSSAAQRPELFQYQIEDHIVTEYLAPPSPLRFPAALEALRVAALSTYENRRVSTGALLLGTDYDPAAPRRVNHEGAPRYNIRLTALKGFHRICDGMNTLYLVDHQGELTRAADIHNWSDRAQGLGPALTPCPSVYASHAKATRSGRHVCMVLSPSQEIKLFSGGELAFAYADARWRLLDIPSKYRAWREAAGESEPRDVARLLFQIALNLAEARDGALLVMLRDPAASIPQLIAPADRIVDEVAADDPLDPDNLAPRLAKRTLHHVVRGSDLFSIDPSVLEALARIDGAVVTDRAGRLITFGAILKIAPDALRVTRAVEGARTLAAIAASFHGPSLKVSEDGLITMFLGGRKVWDL